MSKRPSARVHCCPSIACRISLVALPPWENGGTIRLPPPCGDRGANLAIGLTEAAARSAALSARARQLTP